MVSGDQGRGLFQGWCYLLEVCGLMRWFLFGPSHRTWNYLMQACLDAGLWPFLLELMLLANTGHGPYDGGSWFQKASEGMRKLLSFQGGPLIHPCVRRYRDDILKDCGKSHWRFDEDSGDPVLQALGPSMAGESIGSA